MINYETILSSYDDKLTLMKWLQKVEQALLNSALASVEIHQPNATTAYFTFVFADGSELDSPNLTLPRGLQGVQGEQGEQGEQGVGVSNVTINASQHLIITLTNGVQIDAGYLSNVIVVDNALSASSENPVQNKQITLALANKQDKLTFDNVPTEDSNNPVKSAGIYDALSAKANASNVYTKSEADTLLSAKMANPMTTAGDIIVGGTSGAPARMAKGSANDVLAMDALGTGEQWRDPNTLTPITSEGDLIVGGAGGYPERLAKGAEGKVLKAGATGLQWGDDSAGMTNPMTTQGDVIYGASSGTPTRLAKGTAGQVLTMNSGATAPEWKTPSGGGGGGTQLYLHVLVFGSFFDGRVVINVITTEQTAISSASSMYDALSQLSYLIKVWTSDDIGQINDVIIDGQNSKLFEVINGSIVQVAEKSFSTDDVYTL